MAERAIFNLQRFLILQAKANPSTQHLISDEYAFAWCFGLYPFFSEGDTRLHKDLEEHFEITRKQVNFILTYLDDEWLAGRIYTFYEIEKHFGCRDNPPPEGISRGVLLFTLRYIYLHEGFDQSFWTKLLEPMQHPAEATTIVRDFEISEIGLL
jgi:hypothetical protein